jgi:hypothetical protein
MNTQTIYDTIKTLDTIKKRAIYINNLIAAHDTYCLVGAGLCIVDPKLLRIEMNEFNVVLSFSDSYWGRQEQWIIDNSYFNLSDDEIVTKIKEQIQTHKDNSSNAQIRVLQYQAEQLGYELIKKGE